MPDCTFVASSEISFHRKFEENAGWLKPAEFPVIDWRQRKEIERLFPKYRREQLKFDNNEQRPKVIDIKFTLKSPNNVDVLLDNATLFLETNTRSALFGNTRSGKTCLFEAMSNGSIFNFPSHLFVHHMKELEHTEAHDAASVLDSVLCSHPYRRVLFAVVEKLELFLAGKEGVIKAQDKAPLEANLTYIYKELTNCHGSPDKALQTAQAMLRVLGFDKTSEKAPLSSLSGGLRMRCALACTFFMSPDVLLLDEPTNHLDLPTVLWLETMLRGYKGTFFLVTQDTVLLESAVTSVLLIADQKLKYFPCDFKEFKVRKEQEDTHQEKMRNENLNPMSPLIKQENLNIERKGIRQARNVLMHMKGGIDHQKADDVLRILVKVDQWSPHVLNIKESSKSLECMKMWETGV